MPGINSPVFIKPIQSAILQINKHRSDTMKAADKAVQASIHPEHAIATVRNRSIKSDAMKQVSDNAYKIGIQNNTTPGGAFAGFMLLT